MSWAGATCQSKHSHTGCDVVHRAACLLPTQALLPLLLLPPGRGSLRPMCSITATSSCCVLTKLTRCSPRAAPSGPAGHVGPVPFHFQTASILTTFHWTVWNLGEGESKRWRWCNSDFCILCEIILAPSFLSYKTSVSKLKLTASSGLRTGLPGGRVHFPKS